MSSPAPEIFVNKLAAARRLLRAAVRLHCLKEDALAVHVVASSGYNILNELKRSRGQNEANLVAETEMLGMLKMAQDMAAGRLPANVMAALDKDEYTRRFLERLASQLKITEHTDITSLVESVDVDEQFSRSFHRKRTHAFNFLKHANSDSEALLNEGAVDNFSLMLNAMISYESIAPDDLGLEGATLQLLFLASRETSIAPDHPGHDIIEKLRGMNRDEQLDYCSFQLHRTRPDDM